MKKILAAGLGMLLALTAMSGCGAQQNMVFDAKVLEIRDGELLVQTVDGPQVPPCDEVLVPVDPDALPQLRMGDRIRICYGGGLKDSDPAELRSVYEIERLDSQTILK